jgi:soluble lytic murein transglycosylase-like protein
LGALVALLALALAATGPAARAFVDMSPPASNGVAGRRRRFAKLAARWGAAWGIPSAWIMAIASVESGFRPEVANRSERAMKRGGAWGYMQITRDTARWLLEARPGDFLPYKATAAKFDGTGPSLLDPDLNIMLAARYLALLRREFRTFAATAAAYHSGPATVRKLLAQGKRLPEGLGPRGQQAFAMYQAAAENEGIA